MYSVLHRRIDAALDVGLALAVGLYRVGGTRAREAAQGAPGRPLQAEPGMLPELLRGAPGPNPSPHGDADSRPSAVFRACMACCLGPGTVSLRPEAR